MSKIFLPSFSEKGTRFTLFLFFSLLILSTAVFVFASDTTSTKNIFQDADQDGLGNDEEKLYGTDPMNKDTDGDGYSDGIEVMSGYNPLKPAPGDKVMKEKDASVSTSSQEGAINLTEQVSSEIASLLKSTNKSGQEISLEDINNSVDKVTSGTIEEVILPEVSAKDIKVKRISKNLSEKRQSEQEKKDALEYLTVLSYLIANNSPKTFQTQDDLSAIFNGLSLESIASLASGNMQALDDLSKRGEKMLEELRDIKVPERMLDVHIKALQLAKYAMQLKGELKPSDTDPLGQIAVLSKAQGFFGSITEFSDEVSKKLADLGIDTIPINF
ncbi:MAG: hypothetical protein COZ29_00330 [Candidatus Moranbacteria bacterium CG_4_10_14_3_um_filter_45_9]|nr:MAG: hypothetical protein AUK19_02820 [Candidatus Moranbacteria bacterium CG2_30_45_14]PIX90362.1 MAG: hypothetical protein COZ29_00330 [Candidatus Moranbacteria bacterium CG_4_10_14_3_um_filter_45_9]PJA85507.1 MAG: hypothetical protein CO143_01510 [Candidatus Moranbacteria bacterium CG_4_9_14_3_um_filter_45_14]